MLYKQGYNKNLSIQREQFMNAVVKANNLIELCSILGRSKPSVYTYASRFGIELKGRYSSGIRKQDGYFHYTNKKNHRRILEKYLGIKLERSQGVHHIDGDKTNNAISNLTVMDWSDHQKAHKSLEKCGLELMSLGYVFFDKEKKAYKVK